MTNAREKPCDKQSATVHKKSRKDEPSNVHWKRAMKLIFSYSLFQTQLVWWWDSSSILPFLQSLCMTGTDRQASLLARTRNKSTFFAHNQRLIFERTQVISDFSTLAPMHRASVWQETTSFWVAQHRSVFHSYRSCKVMQFWISPWVQISCDDFVYEVFTVKPNLRRRWL